MRIYFQISLFTLFSGFLAAQNYQFEAINGTYENLSNPISLTEGDCWDEPQFEITENLPIVDWFGTTIDKYLITDSYLFFGNESDEHLISPFSIDLYCNGISINNSYIAYEHGQTMDGEKILKIEWRESGFANLEGFFDIINFQCWIYDSGVIEFHYGSGGTSLAEISYTEVGEVFGAFTGFTNSFTNAMYLEGSSDNFQLETGSIDAEDPPLLTSFPSDGTVYRFSPEVSSTNNETKAEIELISNLVHQQISFRNSANMPIENIAIFNYQGVKVMQFQTNSNQTDYAVERLSEGYYIAQVLADGEIISFSFFKL